MIITSKPPHYLSKISKKPFISIETNSISTQVFGNYDNAMKAIKKNEKQCFTSAKGSI